MPTVVDEGSLVYHTTAEYAGVAAAEHRRLEQELQRHKNRMAVSMWSESHARLTLDKLKQEHTELLDESRWLRGELVAANARADGAEAAAALVVASADVNRQKTL